MKRSLFCFFLILRSIFIYAQTPHAAIPLDSGVYKTWPSLGDGNISGDGKYIVYTKQHGSLVAENLVVDTLVLQSVELNWRVAIPGVQSCRFTDDSRYAVFQNDTNLVLHQLGKNEQIVIPGVIGHNIAGNWVAFKKNDQLNLLNPSSSKTFAFTHADSWLFNEEGTQVLLKTNGLLTLVSLPSGIQKQLWTGASLGVIKFDPFHHEWISFMADSACWYYKPGMEKATRVLHANVKADDPRLKLYEPYRFSSDGTRLFVKFRDHQESPDPSAVRLDIWSYKDRSLQAAQLDQLGDKDYDFAVWLDSKKLVRIRLETDGFVNWSQGGNDDYVNIEQFSLAPGISFKFESWIVSTRDGSRISVPFRGHISYGGKFFVYYNQEQENFFSYELSTGVTRNITRNISTQWRFTDDSYSITGEIAGWVEQDAAVLLHDKYDIWKVDMFGNAIPVNITNGYGRRHHVRFSRSWSDYLFTCVQKNQSLLLTAFNLVNKQNGFFRAAVGAKDKDPSLLHMGDYLYDAPRNGYIKDGANFGPRKAKYAERYLLQRQSAVEARNLFYTDFSNWIQQTNLHAHKNYNWYKTELHSFKLPDGSLSQGVLYKPENFDSLKKYPVIIYFYDRLSDNLNVYIQPEPSFGSLNIPWYASNGYLVFTPDVHYKPHEALTSALECIESAARYCAGLPFVAADKLGLQGLSWGGIQTNYIVTHSKLFAAVCTASGLSNFISGYNEHTHGGSDGSMFYEVGRMGPGASLWQDPDWFIRNSPVMSADKVSSPLLIFHTSVDGACPYRHAVELFCALRRLAKKVWLLEYNEGDHGVWGRSSMDFDLRMQQFFNHYLKDAPAPLWMTRGRPASVKGIESRLELDLSGAQP